MNRKVINSFMNKSKVSWAAKSLTLGEGFRERLS
jgi:hypothetical protein